MDIHSIPPSIPSISSTLTTKKPEKPHQFPREIILRLSTLSILAHRIIAESTPLLYKVIDYLDQPKSTISYSTCESLFESAFIQEFTSIEVNLFLTSFFKKFDPNEELITYNNLDTEGQKFLWEGIIKYYCHEYIGFETEALPLEVLLNLVQEKFDPDKNVINRSPLGLEKKLAEHFHSAMDVFSQFSGEEFTEIKLLLINYCALLISSLPRVEKSENPILILNNGFSIQDLFEEIFILLLELPFLPPLGTPGISKLHEKLDTLNPRALKENFLTALIEYLLDSQDPAYEEKGADIREVMKDCFFLDFEYQEFIQKFEKPPATDF